MLMDSEVLGPRSAWLRRPSSAHVGATPTSPSDRLFAPAGRPAPHSPLLGSPAAGGGRRAAIGPDLEPLARPDFRELGREAAPAAADLQWRVQSGPCFGGEGDSDGSAGWKLPAAEKEASCLSPPAASLCLPLTPSPAAAAPPLPRPPPADVALPRQSSAPPAGALQQRPPPAGSRGPPRQGPCALFLAQACPRSGSSPCAVRGGRGSGGERGLQWPAAWMGRAPWWAVASTAAGGAGVCAPGRLPKLPSAATCPGARLSLVPAHCCLLLTPALDACCHCCPPMPSSANAEVARCLCRRRSRPSAARCPQTRTTTNRDPLARDPAPWFPHRPRRLAAASGHSLHREQLCLSEVNL
nr:translation initiation factor IF-2-like isoform X1 [Manis javanica]XP_036865652.1 translation initiation factor IF-2-like isoform X1 [Manis javanica]XP_036865653.1 translation initiation factor IF-2-like isoform X1 [Manis javanica]